MLSLKGKTALVTGATGGLGSEIVGKLKEEGCQLVCIGRQSGYRQGGEWHYVDLASIGSIYDFIGSLERDIDIIVNCAGVFPQGPLECPVDLRSDAEWENCFAVNVRAPFLLMRALMPGMAARGWGRVLNIGSTSSHQGFKDSAVYCSSKHALLGLSRALDEEYKNRGVRVLILSPGSMKTGMGKQVQWQDYSTFLEPSDVAEAAIYMLKSNEGPTEILMRRRAC